MPDLQETVAYWLFIIIRSVKTFPSFIGNNWAGVILSLAIFLRNTQSRTRASASANPGNSTFSNWKNGWATVLVESWRNLVAVIGCAFVANCLQLSFSDYHSSTLATSQLQSQISAAHQVSVNNRRDCETSTTEIRNQIQVKDAVNRALEKQNRDEQVLIAGCQSQALKLSAPEPLTITPLKMRGAYSTTTQTTRTVPYVVLINKPIAAPMRIAITCNYAIIHASYDILGLSAGQASNNDPSNVIEIDEKLAIWGPKSPLYVALTLNHQKADPDCRVDLR